MNLQISNEQFDLCLGVERNECEVFYVRAEQRTRFTTNIILYGSLAIPISSLSPFALAVYQWYMGNYTPESVFSFYSFW